MEQVMKEQADQDLRAIVFHGLVEQIDALFPPLGENEEEEETDNKRKRESDEDRREDGDTGDTAGRDDQRADADFNKDNFDMEVHELFEKITEWILMFESDGSLNLRDLHLDYYQKNQLKCAIKYEDREGQFYTTNNSNQIYLKMDLMHPNAVDSTRINPPNVSWGFEFGSVIAIQNFANRVKYGPEDVNPGGFVCCCQKRLLNRGAYLRHVEVSETCKESSTLLKGFIGDEFLADWSLIECMESIKTKIQHLGHQLKWEDSSVIRVDASSTSITIAWPRFGSHNNLNVHVPLVYDVCLCAVPNPRHRGEPERCEWQWYKKGCSPPNMLKIEKLDDRHDYFFRVRARSAPEALNKMYTTWSGPSPVFGVSDSSDEE